MGDREYPEIGTLRPCENRLKTLSLSLSRLVSHEQHALISGHAKVSGRRLITLVYRLGRAFLSSAGAEATKPMTMMMMMRLCPITMMRIIGEVINATMPQFVSLLIELQCA